MVFLGCAQARGLFAAELRSSVFQPLSSWVGILKFFLFGHCLGFWACDACFVQVLSALKRVRCLQRLPISDKRSAPENWKMMQTFLENIAGPWFSPRFDQQRYNSKSPLNFRQAVLTLEGSEWFMYERTWEQRLSLLFQRCKGVGGFHAPLFINVCHHVGVNLGVREFTLDGLDEGRPNGPGAAYALDIGGTSREIFLQRVHELLPKEVHAGRRKIKIVLTAESGQYMLCQFKRISYHLRTGRVPHHLKRNVEMYT